MKINYIKDGSLTIAIHIPAKNNNWPVGTSFLTDNDTYIQAATQNYTSGKVIASHKHLEYQRVVKKTQEVLFIKKGKMRAEFFSRKEKKIKTLLLVAGDIIILLAGGHGYKMLSPKTEFLEIKNGPYISEEIDRERI